MCRLPLHLLGRGAHGKYAETLRWFSICCHRNMNEISIQRLRAHVYELADKKSDDSIQCSFSAHKNPIPFPIKVQFLEMILKICSFVYELFYSSCFIQKFGLLDNQKDKRCYNRTAYYQLWAPAECVNNFETSSCVMRPLTCYFESKCRLQLTHQIKQTDVPE